MADREICWKQREPKGSTGPDRGVGEPEATVKEERGSRRNTQEVGQRTHRSVGEPEASAGNKNNGVGEPEAIGYQFRSSRAASVNQRQHKEWQTLAKR